MTDSSTTTSPAIFCPRCGYQLTGLSENRCPECGQAFDPDKSRTFRRRPPRHWLVRWLFRTAIVLLVLASAGLGWLYWGWQAEQPTIAAIQQAGGSVSTRWFCPQWAADMLVHVGALRSNLFGGFYSDGSLWHLFDRVSSVSFRGKSICPEIEKRLLRLEHLECLEISYARIADADLATLSRLPALDQLTLEDVDCNMTGLALVKNLPHLETLILKGMRMDAPRLTALVSPNLQTLWLEDVKITDADLAGLESATGIKKLIFLEVPLGDTGLIHLKNLTNLESLDLQGAQVRGPGLASIARLPKLRQIRIIETPLADTGMTSIQEIRGLDLLELSSTDVTDAGLQGVRNLANLKVLRLTKTRITDAGLQFLQDLTQVQYVELGGIQVTDQCIQYLNKMPNLVHLLLNDAGVTDAGLQQLASAKTLRGVTIYGGGITQEGVRQLRAVRPDLEVDNP